MHDGPDDEFTHAQRELADRLTAERPIPSAGFRGELARYLAARDPRYGPRPQHLRLVVTAYLLIGLLLLALGTLVAVS